MEKVKEKTDDGDSKQSLSEKATDKIIAEAIKQNPNIAGKAASSERVQDQVASQLRPVLIPILKVLALSFASFFIASIALVFGIWYGYISLVIFSIGVYAVIVIKLWKLKSSIPRKVLEQTWR